TEREPAERRREVQDLRSVVVQVRVGRARAESVHTVRRVSAEQAADVRRIGLQLADVIFFTEADFAEGAFDVAPGLVDLVMSLSGAGRRLRPGLELHTEAEDQAVVELGLTLEPDFRVRR